MIRITRENMSREKDCHACCDKIPAKTPFIRVHDAELNQFSGRGFYNFCPKCADKPLSVIALEQKL